MIGVYPRKDLTGKRYGKLQVLRELNKRHKNHRVYLCLCDCGTKLEIPHNQLNGNLRSSCGCGGRKHSMSYTKFYYCWHRMRQRCQVPTNAAYRHYGGRGITVCVRWQKFENFYADMFPTYTEGKSIDRINNDKGYSQQNCRWATMKEQINNRRNTRFITHNGETKSVSEWASLHGLAVSVLGQRFKRGDKGERLFRPLSR